jgi:hypothetical protein
MSKIKFNRGGEVMELEFDTANAQITVGDVKLRAGANLDEVAVVNGKVVDNKTPVTAGTEVKTFPKAAENGLSL